MDNKIELLAPAGNAECLKTAVYFGADAVYAAGNRFGLRAFADNFDEDTLPEAVRFLHGLRKKIYITVNAVMFQHEISPLRSYLAFLDKTGVDGIIFSDPAVLLLCRELGVSVPLHLSTQANTTNGASAAFWHQNGVQRVVLSREVSLSDITQMRHSIPLGLELEAFVHGAMCVAHSGRCLLSGVLTGRSGNKGACAQPCRWEYQLSERGYPDEYFPILEDERGTYIMNSKDLMMIEHIPALAQAGVTSFKIEGRMKSVYYVGSVVGAYRRAIDEYERDPQGYRFDESLKEELVKSATRGFCTGFYFGNPQHEAQDTARDVDARQYTFTAKVLEDTKNGYLWVEQRNKFSVGETLEVLSPKCKDLKFVVEEIQAEDGSVQENAPHPQQKVRLQCPYSLCAGDLLRRQDGGEN